MKNLLAVTAVVSVILLSACSPGGTSSPPQASTPLPGGNSATVPAATPPTTAPPPPAPVAGNREGNVAPDFELSDMNGNPVSLSDYRGKVVLLNFWATW